MNFHVVQADFVTFVEDQAFKTELESTGKIDPEQGTVHNSDSEDFEEIGDIY